MRICCTTTDNFFETNLRAFRKYVGKDIWVMCVYNDEPKLGKLVKVTKLYSYSDEPDRFYMDYYAIDVDLESWTADAWSAVRIFDEKDIQEQISVDIEFGILHIFSNYYHVRTPEELYNTDELLEVFEV